jgi:hypothetical protein
MSYSTALATILIGLGRLRTGSIRAGLAVLVLFGGLGLTLGCGSSHVNPPTIRLLATRNPITTGSSTTLIPQFPTRYSSASIDQDIGSVSNEVPVTVKPTVDTTYTLTYTDPLGTLTTSVTVVVVGVPAITSFTAASSLVTVGTGTTLTAVFSGGAGSVDHGIGPVTSGVAVATGPLAADTTFTLTVNNGAGLTATGTATVATTAAPEAVVITAPADVTAGATGLVASVPAQAGDTYAWAITGGVLTAGAGTSGITFSAGTSGSIVLTCVVTNAAGTASAPGTATIAIVPVPGTPVITSPAFATAGAAGLAASVPAVPGDLYTWTITGGTITAGAATNAITFTAGAAGSLELTCVLTNLAGTLSPTGIAFTTVVAAPTVPVITAPASVTAGAAGYSATTPAQAGSTLAWTITNGTITAGAGTSAITFTAGASGSVGLSCVATNSAGAVSAPGTATCAIVAAPTTPVITGVPATLTTGTAGVTASVTAQAGSTYTWTVTGGTVSAGGTATSTSVTFTVGAVGTLTVTCVVINAGGTASAPGTATSTVVGAPGAPVITGVPAVVTTGTTGITASTTAQAGSTYTWTVTGGTVTAGGTSTSTSVTFTAGAVGTLTVTCVVTNAAGTASAPGTATCSVVAAPTTPVITGVPASLTTGTTGVTASVTAQAGATYTWTVTGGTVTAGGTSTDTSVTFTAGPVGTLTVTCVVTIAGTASAPGTATSTIVAAPITPVITAPATITPSTTGFAASVPAQAGMTFAWTITPDATLETSTGTSILFDTGTSIDITLSCVATNAAGTASAPGTAVWSGGALTAIRLGVIDASNQDWAAIGIKVLGIGLIPQGLDAGSAVPIYTAPDPAPLINLAELDRVGDILGALGVPPGTYSGAVVTLGADPGDVALVSSPQPSSGFPDSPGTHVPPGRIQIQGATGGSGRQTVAVTVPFVSSLQVTTGQTVPLELDFDLSHPAFLVDHRAPGDPAPLWAVNFNGPVRQDPTPADQLVLRHLYGAVTALDPGGLTVAKVFPAWAPAGPGGWKTSSQSLRILPDTAQGTVFLDLDTGAGGILQDFTSLAGTLSGRYVRIAARSGAGGSLVAARIWAGTDLAAVQAGPEGHVLQVDPGNGLLTVMDQAGAWAPVQITPATRFYLRNPADPHADALPIATGLDFLGGLPTGFKVHATLDPAAPAPTALSVDIETYSGSTHSAFLKATALPLGTVATPWNGSVFGLALPGGTGVLQVALGGPDPLAYQVDRTGGTLTVSPMDQNSLASALVTGATVRVYGILQADGQVQAMVVLLYTGILPG